MIAALVVALASRAAVAPIPARPRARWPKWKRRRSSSSPCGVPKGSTAGAGLRFFVDAVRPLLTCAHVLDHMPKDEAPRLRLRDGRERRFSVVTVDREDGPGRAPHRSARRTSWPWPRPRCPASGRPSFSEGSRPVRWTSTTALRLTPGTVVSRERRWATGVRRTVGSRRRIITVKIDPIADAGQSGGPVLAEGTFEAIGVLRANLESATGGLGGTPRKGYSAAVPLLYVKPLLEPKD